MLTTKYIEINLEVVSVEEAHNLINSAVDSANLDGAVEDPGMYLSYDEDYNGEAVTLLIYQKEI